MRPGQTAFLFLDEGGNFDFTPKGSEFFTLTSLLLTRPFEVEQALRNLRYDLMEDGEECEEFHASEDPPPIKYRVFKTLAAHSEAMRVDSVIARKCMTGPSLRKPERFYPKMLGYLIRWVVNQEGLANAKQVIVVTDKIKLKRKQNDLEWGVKTTLKKMLPKGVTYRVMHHDSMSCSCLQAVDYANWAILRKWKNGDVRNYDLIAASVRSEFDIFKNGNKKWY